MIGTGWRASHFLTRADTERGLWRGANGDVAEFSHKSSIESLLLSFAQMFIEELQSLYCQTFNRVT